jgi:hypothetical protein
MSGVPGKRLALCSKDRITTLPVAVVAGVEASLLMTGGEVRSPMTMRLLRYAAIFLGIILAALMITIGAVFIWYGVTGDAIVLGLIPIYVVILVCSAIYYFMTKGD